MRTTPALMAAAVLAAAGVWWLWGPGEAPPVAYRFGHADRGDVADVVTATGTLNAVTQVQIGSQVSGRISTLHVDFNDQVEAGQVVARIDPAPFEAQVAQARAALIKARAASIRTSAAVEVARANARIAEADALAVAANLGKSQLLLENSERTCGRARELGRRNLIAQSEVDTAETDLGRSRAELEVLKAQVTAARAKAGAAESQIGQAAAEVEANKGEISQAEAALSLALTNLSFTKIVSPIRGVVISRSVDVGQTVAASFQAPVLFLIADDLTRMQIIANVDEADIGRTRTAQEVTFTVDAYPQRKFRGTVRQIRLAPIVSQNVVTYHVVVDVENPRLLLKPGMTSNATLLVNHRQDVLRVPNAALSFTPPTTHSAWVAEGSPAGKGSAASAGRGAGTSEGAGRRGRPGGGEGRSRRRSDGRPGERTKETTPPTGADGSDESDGPRPGRVFVRSGDGLRPASVVAGITDGTYTEILSGELREGDEVAIGVTRESAADSQGPSLLQRMRRGGRGGGGGSRI